MELASDLALKMRMSERIKKGIQKGVYVKTRDWQPLTNGNLKHGALESIAVKVKRVAFEVGKNWKQKDEDYGDGKEDEVCENQNGDLSRQRELSLHTSLIAALFNKPEQLDVQGKGYQVQQ